LAIILRPWLLCHIQYVGSPPIFKNSRGSASTTAQSSVCTPLASDRCPWRHHGPWSPHSVATVLLCRQQTGSTLSRSLVCRSGKQLKVVTQF